MLLRSGPVILRLLQALAASHRTLSSDREHFLIVENKVTYRGCLADNQIENYPLLATWLAERAISFDLLFLQSAGCHETLYKQAKEFQSVSWGSHFGILLWEEVIELMKKSGFTPTGLPVDDWQQFAVGLELDCERDA